MAYHSVHSKHKRIIKKIFKRRRVITRFPFQIFQADLIEYTNNRFVYANRQYKYILVVIDCFTKKVWAVPMKEKTGEWTANSIQSILDELPEMPVHIITDKGTGKVLCVFHEIHVFNMKNTEIH